MPVSGLVLMCEQAAVEDLRRRIAARPGLEVRGLQGSSLIVVTDTATLEQDRACVDWLASQPGVLSAWVTFTNIEDVSAGPGEPAPA